MEMRDWAIVVATILGPILAVQAQKWVERWRDKHNRRMWIFSTLMATRATRVAPEHVRALNMIDLEYYGRRIFGRPWRTPAEQTVLDSWKEYLDDLSAELPDDESAKAARLAHREEIFTNLLFSLAKCNSFKFDRVQIKKGIYFPVAQQKAIEEQDALRRLLLELAKGDRTLKMDVTSFPADQSATEAMKTFHESLSAAAKGNGAVTVRLLTDADSHA
jgi:hypothetical protein